MTQRHCTADIAITSEGNALAVLHEQILFFETIKDLDAYIGRLYAQRNLIVNKIVPLDDLAEGEADEAVVANIERWLGSVRKNPETISSHEEMNSLTHEDGNGLGIRDAFGGFLKVTGWEVDEEIGGQTLKINVRGKNGNWVAHAIPIEDANQALFVSICPIQAPESKRASMAEFITRANFGLRMGNFEMDYNHGDIRYKTSIDVEGTSLTHPLVQQLVTINLEMMDRYLPGIMRVIEKDMVPEEAINLVETGSIPWQ